MIDTKLTDKVVIVTGANNPCGIGAAIARAFAAEGARVFITYFRQSPEEYGDISTEEALRATEPGLPFYYAMQTRSADEVLQAIRDQGGEAVAWEADLADPSNISEVFDRAEAAFGPVHVLVNNAAYDKWPNTIFTADAESIDKHFAVNTRAVVLMIAEFVRRYREREADWGRIVNLSTDAAQCFAGSISYGASKAATEAFTRSIAVEVGPLGITVNTVAPGPVQTGSYSRESVARERALIPLGRTGRPEDIADVVVFLASDQARWLTGQVIKVSGGHAI
jgi:3-oxoacyl-[acyl-carrier protein] reductase